MIRNIRTCNPPRGGNSRYFVMKRSPFSIPGGMDCAKGKRFAHAALTPLDGRVCVGQAPRRRKHGAARTANSTMSVAAPIMATSPKRAAPAISFPFRKMPSAMRRASRGPTSRHAVSATAA